MSLFDVFNLKQPAKEPSHPMDMYSHLVPKTLPWLILNGDALKLLKSLQSESYDACYCDPPYGISFMGREWDHGVPSKEVWAEVFRVLKPGAPLMAFGGTRMWHRLAINIEDAGFEFEDAYQWVFGSGFPKALDLSKAMQKAVDKGVQGVTQEDVAKWDGYKTALKPAWEPLVMAYKPGTRGPGVERKDQFYYTGKASRKEREAGLVPKVGEERANSHPCLHPDSLVMTSKGYRPIREVQVGDLVYTQSGVMSAVYSVSSHAYQSENLFELDVAGTNLNTQITDNHPMLIWRPERKGGAIIGGEVAWVSGDKVRKGDYTMTPLDPSQEEGQNEAFWWLMGLYAAEGSLQNAGHGSNVYPTFTVHEAEVASVVQMISQVTDARVSVYDRPSRAKTVMVFDPELGAECLRLVGKHSDRKTLDESIWSEPLNHRKAILEGWLYGDGGIVRTYIQGKSVSLNLASQMLFIAIQSGYKANLHREKVTPGKIESHIEGRPIYARHDVYQIRIYEGLHRTSTRKSDRPNHVEFEGQMYLIRYVKRVTEVPYSGDVVNLSVLGCPTFQTSAGMSHNTVKPIDLNRHFTSKILPLDASEPTRLLTPFSGSGSEMIGAFKGGWDHVTGIELQEQHVAIAHQRLEWWVFGGGSDD